MRQRTQTLAQELANRETTEAALHISEERFRRLFASTPVPTFVWRYADGQFTLSDANQAALDITEGKFGDIQGLAATTIYDKRPDIVERLHTCRTEQTILVYETTYHTRSTDKDLGIIFTFAYVSPDLILLHAEDVTARRRTETALNIEHANLLALIENTDGSIWSIDRNYRLIAGNAAFHQHTRVAFGREYAVGEDIFALGNIDEARNDWRHYYDLALAGEQFNLQVQRRFVELPRWIEYRFNPIRDHTSDITGVTVFGRDITEQKLAEATLRASEERFRLAFENANDGVSLIDLDGRLSRL